MRLNCKSSFNYCNLRLLAYVSPSRPRRLCCHSLLSVTSAVVRRVNVDKWLKWTKEYSVLLLLWSSTLALTIDEDHYLYCKHFISLFLPSVLRRCWLGGWKGIRPVKTERWGCWRGYLSGARCWLAWPSWCHCHSLSLASVKSRLVLPFWYRLTRIYSPDKGQLNGCVCVRVSVCVRVCLSAIISLELHVRSSTNVLCLLPMAAAWSFSGGIVICYVLPVLWMTSYLLISQACQGCSTSPPSWRAVHTQPWAWL